MEIDKAVALFASILAILGVLDAGMQRFTRRATSKYAAERDFSHLRRNQEQIKESMAVILEENDKLNEDVIKMKAQLETLIGMQRER